MSDPYVPAGCTSDGRLIPLGFRRHRAMVSESSRFKCRGCRGAYLEGNVQFYSGPKDVWIYCHECERDVDRDGYFHGRFED